jgi:hypothetical protein
MRISRRRSLLVVVVAVAAGLAVGVAIGASALAVSQRQSAASPGTFAGLGTAVLGAALAFVVGFTVAVVAVRVGLRRRERAGRFTAYFAGTLLIVLVIGYTVPLAASSLVPSSAAGAPGLALLPLVWVLPAVLSGVLRVRWLLIAAGAAAIAIVVASLVAGAAERDAQRAIEAAYDGPILVPSTSPGSPVPDYGLRSVKLPGPYEEYDGATRVSLSYAHPTADRLLDESYDIEFSSGRGAYLCGGSYPECATVGTALGGDVKANDSDNSFLLLLDGGVVTVQGYTLSEEDALAILRDLHRGSLADVSALTIDPRYAKD